MQEQVNQDPLGGAQGVGLQGPGVGLQGQGPGVGLQGQGPGDGGRPGHLLPMDDLHDQTPPTMACPICSRADFKTTGDLLRHSATCT